ncbi:MAG: protease modulator HflC [Clostridia bacterium]|nr:protease modulator HflC [Clostridia bacterium]
MQFNNQNPNGQNFNDFQEKTRQRAEDIAKNAKKAAKRGIAALIILFVLIGASSFFYIVAEDEVATVKQLGETKKVIVDVDNDTAASQSQLDPKFANIEIVRDKGLFFKIPFITTVEKDTSKLITYISNSAQINTKDKIKYQISMFAQWEISHPGLYRSSLGNVQRANANIDEVAYAVVIEKINGLTSREFLTDKEALYTALDGALVELNEKMAPKGIVLKDIEVYRTILPDSNIESTYKKMVAERGAIAQKKRSEGQELYQNTVADTDRKVAETIAESIETSEKIIGEADASALEIYAEAFSKDPEFYEYWRTLKSYEKTINSDTVIYMDKNNDYLKYFRGN